MSRTTYRCPECGHDEISFEGFIAWSDADQQFEVVDVCDKGHRCSNCEYEGYCGDFEAVCAAPDLDATPAQAAAALDRHDR